MTLDAVRVCIGERTLLRDVRLGAEPGSVTALVGPNGVGKTTLLRTIAGLHPPAAGAVLYDGRDVRDLNKRERATSIAMVGDDDEIVRGMSAREIVGTGRFAQRAWWDWTRSDTDALATDAALEQVELRELAERSFEDLSSGERQRTLIALALAQNARTLILDEPTSHLDARFALEILHLLRMLAADGRTILIALHDLNEAAAFADRVVVLGEETVLANGVPQRALEPAILERAYGVPFERIESAGGVRVLPLVPAPPKRIR